MGLTNNLARLLAACNSVSYFLFSLIGIPNVERWGRRKMMMYAAAGQFFCYTVITICIRYNEDTSLSVSTNRAWAKGSIAFFFLYYVFFGIGWQGVPWVCAHAIIREGLLTTTSSTRQRSTPWLCERKVLRLEQRQTGKDHKGSSYQTFAKEFTAGSSISWSSRSPLQASKVYTGVSTLFGSSSTLRLSR